MIWIDRLRTDNSLRKIIHSDNTEELVHIEEEPTNVLRVGTLLGNENLNTFEKNIGSYGEDTYDNESTYEVGDIVTYQGLLYKCIVQIDEAEEFNSSHWQNINLVQEKASKDETSSLANQISQLLTQIEDLEAELQTKSQKHIITAFNTANQSVTNRTMINLAGQIKTGTKLILSNNRVLIGEDVSKVKISASIFFENFTHGNGYLYPSINKNGAWISRAIEAKGVVGSTDFQSVSFAPAVVSVAEGDEISLNAYDVGDESVTVRGNNTQLTTWLTVEVVE